MVLWIFQSWECLLLLVSQSCCWISTSIPELNSDGSVVNVLCRMGCYSGMVIVRSAYFLQVCWSRMAVGGIDASSSIGMIGDVRNAPRIRQDAVFWSICRLSMYLFCPPNHASAPKSRIGRTQVVYSWRKCYELRPHSLVFSLEAI